MDGRHSKFAWSDLPLPSSGWHTSPAPCDQADLLFHRLGYRRGAGCRRLGPFSAPLCPRQACSVSGFERQPSGSGANTWANSCAGVGNPNCRRTRACSGVSRVACTTRPRRVRPLDQPVAAKQPQQGLRRPVPLRRGRIGRHALAVEPLQHLVGGQRHLHQADQRLDTPPATSGTPDGPPTASSTGGGPAPHNSAACTG